ncbi:MAG TPA: helical backbone metal receptor [Fodinibius sp.]|nr:helical backbone metal receptor [Fodinibius sp.]
MVKNITFFLSIVVLVSAPAIAQTTVQSADDRQVKITDDSRIVTLGSSITETVFALGMGEQVIAVDQSSTYPQEVHQLPKVPYVRTLNAEGILSLNPSLVLSTSDARPASVLNQIRSAGVPVLMISDEPTVDHTIRKIELIGEALQQEERARQLVSDMQQKLDKAEGRRATIDQEPRVMFILSNDGQKSVMVAGKNSSAETIIEMAGGQPVFNSFNGYKTVSPEAIISANPEIILIMDTREETAGGIESLKKNTGISLTDAVQNDQLISIDGNYLIGFGPRLGDAVLELMDKLHPNLQTAVSE